MHYAAYVLFAIILAKICYADQSHPEHIGNLDTNEWLVRITEGIEEAKKIAETEQFQITNEIPALNLYHFTHKNPDEDKQIDDMLKKFSQHKKISWSYPIKISKHEIPNNLFGLPDVSGDGAQNEGVNPFSMLFGGEQVEAAPSESGSAKYYSPGTKLEPISYRPEMKTYPDVLCAGSSAYIVKSDKPLMFNDPLYPQQYFLRSCSELEEPIPTYYDIKLLQTWQDFKVYGKGIVVLVLDDGVITGHKDLDVDLAFSYNVKTKIKDPRPGPGETHGTYCAGLIGMKRNNGVCGVGIAPEATIGGIKMQNNHQSNSAMKADALIFRYQDVHIMTTAVSDQELLTFLPKEMESALQKGGTEGRGGKGILYVASSGNQKDEKRALSCSRAAFNNDIHVITIGGVNRDGTVSPYANNCSNVMAVIYSGDGHPFTMPTIAPGPGNTSCNDSYSGTSASAPMAAGTLALVLEANQDLTWRDVHHIIAWTCEIAPLTKESNPEKEIIGTKWIQNNAGFYISLDFGFGLLDVYSMVELAKNFKETTPPMHGCKVSPSAPVNNRRVGPGSPVRIQFPTNGCQGTGMDVNYVEHVILNVDMRYKYRGDLRITLKSGKGTTIDVLEPRGYDWTDGKISDYNFHSLHAWGENPEGTWIVEMSDESGNGQNVGEIYKVELMLYGTKTQPELYKNGKRKYYPFKLETSRTNFRY